LPAADAAAAAAADSEHAIMAGTAPTDPYVALLQRAMLHRLQSMGFSRAEAREALEAAGWIEVGGLYKLNTGLYKLNSGLYKLNTGHSLKDAWFQQSLSLYNEKRFQRLLSKCNLYRYIEEDATYYLLRSLQPAGLVSGGGGEAGGGGGLSEEEAKEERGEEALALAAILEEAFVDLTGEFPSEEEEERKTQDKEKQEKSGGVGGGGAGGGGGGGKWDCPACTFRNASSNNARCGVCDALRPGDTGWKRSESSSGGGSSGGGASGGGSKEGGDGSGVGGGISGNGSGGSSGGGGGGASGACRCEACACGRPCLFEAELSSQKMWIVAVAPDDDRWLPCKLEVHFPPGCVYPSEPPLVSVQQSNLPPPIRRSVAAQLAAQAWSLVGEVVLYNKPRIQFTRSLTAISQPLNL
jgi:hypothetical protein